MATHAVHLTPLDVFLLENLFLEQDARDRTVVFGICFAPSTCPCVVQTVWRDEPKEMECSIEHSLASTTQVVLRRGAIRIRFSLPPTPSTGLYPVDISIWEGDRLVISDQTTAQVSFDGADVTLRIFEYR